MWKTTFPNIVISIFGERNLKNTYHILKYQIHGQNYTETISEHMGLVCRYIQPIGFRCLDKTYTASVSI